MNHTSIQELNTNTNHTIIQELNTNTRSEVITEAENEELNQWTKTAEHVITLRKITCGSRQSWLRWVVALSPVEASTGSGGDAWVGDSRLLPAWRLRRYEDAKRPAAGAGCGTPASVSGDGRFLSRFGGEIERRRTVTQPTEGKRSQSSSCSKH